MRRLAWPLLLCGVTTSCGVSVSQGSPAVDRLETPPSISVVAHLEVSTVGVTVGPSGEIYLLQEGCDDLYTNNSHRYIPSAVLRLNPNGTTTRLAGGFPHCGSSGDGGPAVRANLDEPLGILADKAGNIYVADQYGERVRRITPQGMINTVAGSGPVQRGAYGGDGGPATRARLNRPCGLALDTAGNLYITELDNHVVRKVTPAGTISAVAGTGREGFSGDGGPATTAQLHFPLAVAVDAAGNVYIADRDNKRVRKVTPGGTIGTVVGNGLQGNPTDGMGATATSLDQPEAVAVSSDGTLFIADNGHSLLRIGKDGKVHIIDPPHGFWNPIALAFDRDGNLFLIDEQQLDNRILYKLTWSH